VKRFQFKINNLDLTITKSFWRKGEFGVELWFINAELKQLTIVNYQLYLAYF